MESLHANERRWEHMLPRRSVALAFVLTACSGPHVAPRPAPPPAPAPVTVHEPPPPEKPAIIGIVLDVSPADAEVVVDGVSRGAASALSAGVPLDPGVHQLVIKRDGFRPYRVEFTVSDKAEEFAVRLEPVR